MRLTKYRRGGPAERAGRPEGWRRCAGGDGGGVTTGHLKVTRRRRWARCGEISLGGAVGGGDCSAVTAGDRPRLGGWATGTSGGDVQAFSLRVETVSTLSPTCNLKKRRERSRTKNGPS